MSLRSPTLLVLILLTVGFIGLGSVESKAQSPASIGGQAAILQVTSGTAPLFASAGSTVRILPSATDNSYGVIALSGNAVNGYGSYSYSKTGTNTATISYNDVPSGTTGYVALFTFTSSTAGTYSITNANYPGYSETGTFTLFSGQAPTSLQGWTFQLQIDAGVAPYATFGTAELIVSNSNNSYQIIAESGNVIDSSGTYAYTTYPQNSSASSSITSDDTVTGPEYTQTLSWQTSTSGAYVVRNVSTGGYQTGTFTGSPPAQPQTITFPAIATHQYPGTPFVLNATAGSGLSVSYNLVSGPATLSGTNNDTVNVTGIGEVIIQASQGGNANYLAATSVNESFMVAAPVSFTGDPTATPEGDGVPDLLKYLFDIDPSVPMISSDRAALPTVGVDSTTNPGTEYLTLTYRQYALKTGITVNVQSSSDLQSWTTVTPNITQQVGIDPDTGDPIMEYEVNTNGATEKFIRLNVTQP